jgi:hypothetical protein
MDKKFTTDQILKEAFTSFKENSKYFLILGSIYAVLLLSLVYVFEPHKPEETFKSLIMSILFLLIHAKLAIMVHRSVLLKESDLNKIFSWTTKELKFILIVIGLYLGVFVTIGILSAFLIPFAVNVEKLYYFSLMFIPVLIIIGLIIVSRVSLVFPAIAIRRNIKLSDSWSQTKGHTFSLFVLLVLVPFLSSLLQNKLAGDSVVLTAVFSFISVFVLIFEVTILSHCFIAFFGENKIPETETITEIV